MSRARRHIISIRAASDADLYKNNGGVEMLKLIVIFIAGLVIGAVWGWGVGIMSMLAKREMKPG